MDRFNEQIKFLARKNLAQNKRITLLGNRVKSKRDLQNQQSIRTILPQHNKQNIPIPSIKVSHPQGQKHFSGALHLYLRSSIPKYSQKRHVKQPSHPQPILSSRKLNYQAPQSKQQYLRIRSKSTLKSKVDKDLKSQLSSSLFARQSCDRPPSRRKYLQQIDFNKTDRNRRSGVKMIKIDNNIPESETKRLIKKRDDFMRSSFKLG